MRAGHPERLGPRPPSDRGARARLVHAATAAASASASAPAGPGAAADRGEGRGWPALLGGALATAVLVAALSLVGAVRSPSGPSLAEGDLVVGRLSAARYLELGGRLHPVLNTASARLVTTTPPRTVVVDDEVLASLPHGPVIGIPGAPDDLPSAGRLRPDGWLACADGAAVRVRLGGDGRARPASASPTSPSAPPSAPPSGPPAVVVVPPGPSPVRYLLVGGRRLALPPGSAAALTGAVGRTAPAQVVPAALLHLFVPGTPLDSASLTLGPGLGAPLTAALRRPGIERVGQLVDTGGTSAVVVADGLLPLDPFSAAVYAATAPSGLGHPVGLAAADLGSVPLSDHADPAPPDWPRERPGPQVGVPCAALGPASGGAASTTLVLLPDPPAAPASAPAPAPVTAAVDVPPGGGALVRVGPDGSGGRVLLVDGTGTAFPVADPVAPTLSRLGYGGVPVPSIPRAWADLLPRGPDLASLSARRGPG